MVAMADATSKFTTIVERYFSALRELRSLGGATPELSTYAALSNLFNEIGDTLKPKVVSLQQIVDTGGGHPDFGLYVKRGQQKGKKGQPSQGQKPERGVVEVKPATDDAWLTAESDQVSKYWEHYRLVLVTNTRDFVLLGEDSDGNASKLETFRLADSAADFEKSLEHPRAFANKVGPALGEYLGRGLSHTATLSEPRDLAQLLASYARDALSRVEVASDASSLLAVRSALEEALGVRFEGQRGAAFFRSAMVQTLFYGVFSAWVLWSRQTPTRTGKFSWHEAAAYLRVPVLRALFYQLADPGKLKPLDLEEVLDWTAAALDRVNRQEFFSKFNEGEAVPYFYEPFLQAFDPDLRKQLGVWYTPVEVVRYMVARVDRALKDDLGIADGLAADNVYVLDPCCGTGAYLAETLRRIAANLQAKGEGAMTGVGVKKAATQRVFGFEVMPAPFVVAHLQVGITMQDLDAPLSEDGTERAGVYLTNALTGWEPRTQKPLPFPELEQERDQAERVKRETPVLVVLGNPPYNAFAGVEIDEERELFEAYRLTRKVQLKESKGLIDLYVRFFRMAERRIVEKTGRGVVCLISNYSWLDGMSFAGMRERYLEVFDAIRIDCLNGDKYKTGKMTPDGRPDPSIFSTDEDSVGIQVGTAITTLVRKAEHEPSDTIWFRHLWGQSKRGELVDSAEAHPDILYEAIEPLLLLGLPFFPMKLSDSWSEWPSLPELFPVSFPGAKTNRDSFLVDIDFDRLSARISDYFNPELSHEEISRRYPVIMNTVRHFDARSTRDTLLRRGGPSQSGFTQFVYRPFDTRWLYWEGETKLLNDKRAAYKGHVFQGNLWVEARQRQVKEDFSRGTLVRHFAGDFGNGLSQFFSIWLREEGLGLESDGAQRRPNLSPASQAYLDRLGLGVEDLFHHVLAVLHDPAYREANAGALRMEWPRIPLPAWPGGDAPGAADELKASAARGRKLAALLDSDTPVDGVTQGTLRPEMAAIGVPAKIGGGNMAGEDFALTQGWGHFGQGEAVMPGQGRVVERGYEAEDREALGGAVSVLGDTTFDVYLNEWAYWCNVPAAVWGYKLSGYQVLKKWLSYRESKVLGRPLLPEEVRHFRDTARRIGAILLETASTSV